MPRARHRRPERYHAPPSAVFHIVNAAGRVLSSIDKVPFVWTDRESMGLAFHSSVDAERMLSRLFASPVTARALGIHIERVL